MADLFAFPPPPPPSSYFSLPIIHYDKEFNYFQAHPEGDKETPKPERTTKTVQEIFGAVSRMSDDEQTKFLLRLIQTAGVLFEPAIFQRVADELNIGRGRGV